MTHKPWIFGLLFAAATGMAAVGVGLGAAWRLPEPRLAPAPPAAAGAAAAPGTSTAAAAEAAPATWRAGRVTLTQCELKQPQTGLSTPAWCGRLPVPENRADPHGRRIGLNFAVLRSNAEHADADWLAFLAGGPGQAATESAGAAAGALGPLLAHHHVLLLDQRGTGGSNPLACDEDDAGRADAGDAFDAAKIRAAARACLARLQPYADPRYYTTTIAAEDLEDLRQALGAPPLDLVAVSYGTRLAQQYARAYPHAVRSMVLDSVVPNALVLGEDFAANLDAALHAQFGRCGAESACAKRFGDVWQTLVQLRDALRANPHRVSFRDPQTYLRDSQVLDADLLASVVRMFAYTPATAALLPLSIDAAAHGDVGPLLGQAKILSGSLTELAGSGMQYSVICSEDADLYTPRPQDQDTLLGTRLTQAMQAVCAVWPKGARPADFHAPLVSSVPTLLLAGQFDPVTPPRYAEEVARHLARSRVLVLRGQAHNVMAAGCTPDLIRRFVRDLDPRTLDASCLDHLSGVPIFLDFNGGTP